VYRKSSTSLTRRAACASPYARAEQENDGTTSQTPALAVLCILRALTAGAHGETYYEFNLPQQSLADALRAIGRLTNMNILFKPVTVENVTAPALRGRLSPEEAIKRVLAGTKLVVEQTAADSVLIAPARKQETSQPRTSGVSPLTRFYSKTHGDRRIRMTGSRVEMRISFWRRMKATPISQGHQCVRPKATGASACAS
jgi:hypothetical protein